MNKGGKHSLKNIEKIKKSRLGKNIGHPWYHNDDTIEKMRKSSLGKILSENTKNKIGAFRKGKKHSEESKKKISEGNKGKSRGIGHVVSEELRKKLSESNKGKHKVSDETRRKLSEANRGKFGEKSSNWKGGITSTITFIRNSNKYLEWRQNCFIKDNFNCQKCGIHGGNLEVHHKKSFSNLLKEAIRSMPLLSIYDACMFYSPMWDISNGITLCQKCHRYKGGHGKIK